MHDTQGLPKYLLADDGEERDFVVHLNYPRFLFEVSDNLTGNVVLWLDPVSDFIEAEQNAGREPALSIARLAREALEFWLDCPD